MSANIGTSPVRATATHVQVGGVIVREHETLLGALDDPQVRALPSGAAVVRGGITLAVLRKSFSPAGRQIAEWVLS